VNDLLHDPLVVGALDLDPVGEPAEVSFGVGLPGPDRHHLVALGRQCPDALYRPANCSSGIETSITLCPVTAGFEAEQEDHD
jgi:hypothetical protein